MLCADGTMLTDIAAPGPQVFASDCVYLMRFITGDARGAKRFGALFRGDVGSSTQANGHSFGVALASGFTVDSVPADAQEGEHFFFAMWEDRGGATNDTKRFTAYFTQSAMLPYTPPHGNYVIIPFMYSIGI